ncbi:hypothetical protein PIB30_036473 [Stylosanthes scabra]|uniref:Disease resistance protein RPS4B/Roq1-like leucine-rich repeats domain-containing protein n=1 Tax=Stylosanthes scabra TaxID=79078 RepID=A0ABU6WBX6_9FABA|nr:hypothetical protein [Stylosanthes scabra]
MVGKHSRLWLCKDIVEVLENNGGTGAIEIIHLEFPLLKRKEEEDPLKEEKNEDVEIKWDGTAFKEMKNLKTLIIKNGCFSKGLKYLPNSLRVLEWWRYPSNSFPYDFQPKELSILKLPHNLHVSSNLDSLSKKLVTLKILNLDHIDSLKEIPDISSLQILQERSFKECSNLVTVHNSVGFFNKLEILDAENCPKLSSFPPVIHLPSLEVLKLNGCSNLENFPEIAEKIAKLTRLDLRGTGITYLPYSLCNLSGLCCLLMWSHEMCNILSVIVMMPELSHCYTWGVGNERWEMGLNGLLTHSLPSSNITCLFLKNVKLKDDFFLLAVVWFPNVDFLELSGNDFTIIPECIQEFRFLWYLNLDNCQSLQEITGIPPNLKWFSAKNCKLMSPGGSSVLLNQVL